jgi:hypothetical protein
MPKRRLKSPDAGSAPKNKSGPKSDKVWADAVRKAVHEYHVEKDPEGKVKKTRYLNLLALNLVKEGADGNVAAIKEIGDRLDGKANQSVDLKATSTITIVEEQVSTTTEWLAGLVGDGAAQKGKKPLPH